MEESEHDRRNADCQRYLDLTKGRYVCLCRHINRQPAKTAVGECPTAGSTIPTTLESVIRRFPQPPKGPQLESWYQPRDNHLADPAPQGKSHD